MAGILLALPSGRVSSIRVCGHSSTHADLLTCIQVDRDSVVLDPGLAGSSDHHGPAMMAAPQMAAPVMPMTYMTPGMAALPPYGRIDPSYGMQRPGGWPGPSMPAYGQPMPAALAQQANLQAAAAAAFQAMAPVQPGLPVPAVAGHADLPRPVPYSAASDLQHPQQPQLPPQSQAPPPPPQQPPSPQQQQTFPARGAPEAGADSGGSLPPELQQLVRQLALSQLGRPADNP